MAISKKDLLKELLPGLNKLFGVEYDSFDYEIVGYEDNYQIIKKFHRGDEEFISKHYNKQEAEAMKKLLEFSDG